MAKFSNAKIGDGVWSSVYGKGDIVNIESKVDYPIDVKFDKEIRISYTLDGKKYKFDKYPTLFWNEFNIPTEEEDKPPFNLVEFLKENLEPKEFEYYKGNEYIIHRDGELDCSSTAYAEIPTVYFKAVYDPVLDILNTNKVTIKQLKQSYKELGWL